MTGGATAPLAPPLATAMDTVPCQFIKINSMIALLYEGMCGGGCPGPSVVEDGIFLGIKISGFFPIHGKVNTRHHGPAFSPKAIRGA